MGFNQSIWTSLLETDPDKNVQFYEQFGFQVVGESDIFDVKNRYR